MNTKKVSAAKMAALSALFLAVGAESAQAMPMFARKYKVDCAMCHAAVPRLSFTGFRFKAAGYRMAWEVGKPQDEKLLALENYTAFIAFINASSTLTSNQVSGPSAQFNVQEADLRPLTGSWGANWSSDIEVDALANGTVSLNQAYLGFTGGTPESFWTIVAGLVPNFLGYGPLDRSMAVSAPLVLTNSASSSAQDTLFTWAGPRASGLTASTWFGDTFLSASVRNRLAVTLDTTGSVTGGPDALGSPSTNRMGDVLLSATQFFDHTGSGSAVSLAYYHGQTHLPVPGAGTTVYANNFDHLLGAANYYVTERWNLFGGAGWGQDQAVDAVSGSLNQELNHSGFFGGAEYFFGPTQALGARYDFFRSDMNTPGTDVRELTFYYNLRPINQVILSTEFQFQQYGSGNINPELQGLSQSTLTFQALLAF